MLSKNQKVIYVVIIVLIIAILAGLTWLTLSNNPVDNNQARTENIKQETKPVDTESEINQDLVTDDPRNELALALEGEVYDLEAKLVDVSGGNASGFAMSKYRVKTGFQLFAEFKDLPELKEDTFYEGWVVRKEPFAFISTGKVEMLDGELVNAFEVDKDYTDYTSYVLTLEPNDNDPAPAKHILEGEMEEITGLK